MNRAILTQNDQLALDALKKAATECGKRGIIVFCAARFEQDDGWTHFQTQLAVPDNMSNEMLDHCFADAIRDLGVEWNNRRHSIRLEWSTE